MKKHSSRLTVAVLCALVLVFALAGPASAAEAPEGVITGVHEELVTIPTDGTTVRDATLKGGLRILAEAEGMTVSIEKSVVSGPVTVEAADVKVVVDKDTKVETLTVDASAKGASVTVNGTVTNLVVDAEGAAVNGAGTVEALTANEDVKVAAALKVEETEGDGDVSKVVTSDGAVVVTDDSASDIWSGDASGDTSDTASKQTTMVIFPVGEKNPELAVEALENGESLEVTIDTSALKTVADALTEAEEKGESISQNFDFDSVEVYLCVTGDTQYLVITGATPVNEGGLPAAVEERFEGSKFEEGDWYKSDSSFTVECTEEERGYVFIGSVAVADIVEEENEGGDSKDPDGKDSQTTEPAQVIVGQGDLHLKLNFSVDEEPGNQEPTQPEKPTTPAEGDKTEGGDQQPEQEPAGEATEQPAEEATEQSTEEPAEQPTEEPAGEPAEQPTEEPAEQPTEQLTEEPAEQPTEQPTEELTEKSAEEVTEQSAEKATEEPAEEVTEQPAEKATEQPAGETTEEPAEEITEQPAEEPTEGSAEELTTSSEGGSTESGGQQLEQGNAVA